MLQDLAAQRAAGDLQPFKGTRQSRLLKRGRPGAYPPFNVFFGMEKAKLTQECEKAGVPADAENLSRQGKAMWRALSENDQQRYKDEAARRGAQRAAEHNAAGG